MPFSTSDAEAFRAVLGAEAVVVDPEALARAGQTTFPVDRQPIAILSPASADEVQACVRLARERGVRLYPVSRGRNWGYGSRVPTAPDCALLDLSRLDRVLGYDQRLGALTIEPGVTFAQAAAFLAERGGRHVLATIGGPPDASILANALERGDGAGPNGEAFSHVCGLEVVLGTGERLRTGHARFPGAKTAASFRWGVGPQLDGLFSQSPFGVVTRLTIWLARAPAVVDALLAAVDSEAKLPALVDATQELLAEGTLRGTCALWNEYKAVSKLTQFPFREAGRPPLGDAWMRRFREGFPFGRWNFSATIHSATPAQADAARARVEARLNGLADRLLFQDREEARRAIGVPSRENLRMAYWRKRTPMPELADADRDRCGVLWCSVAAPLAGDDAALACDISERVLRLFGFEPNLAFLAVSPLSAYAISLILWDRDTQADDERALACHEALLRELCEAGFFPARLGLQAMTPPLPPDDDSLEVLRRLRAALDPAGVLAPGRYGI